MGTARATDTSRPVSEELLRELVRRIVDAVHPLRIVLFGSAARGEMGAHSDLDVLVVMPDGVSRGTTTEKVYLGLAGLGFATDVVVVCRADLDAYRFDPYRVVKYALDQGRELYRATAED